MKKTKLFVVLMMMFAMLFAFDNTAKAAEEEGLDIAISADKPLSNGQELTFKVDITNNFIDVAYPAEEFKIDVYYSGLELSPQNGWTLVDNADVKLIATETFAFCNVNEFKPGDTISFEITGIFEKDYKPGDVLCVDTYFWNGEEYEYIEDESYPNQIIEVTTDLPLRDSMTAKRGQTINGKLYVKNILDMELDSLNLWLVGYAYGVQDDYEEINEKMNLSSDWEFESLAPGETKELNFSFVIPADIISSTLNITFTIDYDYMMYDEDTGEEWPNYYELCYEWFDINIEGGTINPFKDVSSNDWFSKYALAVYENGLMTGMNPTTFGPTVKLSRAQFATILYRMEYEPELSGAPNPFPDVPGGQFYTGPALWAAENGIITGYDNGNFGPNDMITREQMATILYRYLINYLGYEYEIDVEKALSAFPDAANVSAFAREGMAWAVSEGIITGDGGRLNPQGTADRAQCATIISRFCGLEE